MAGKRYYFPCCFLLQPCFYHCWTVRVEEHSLSGSRPERLQEGTGGICPKRKRDLGSASPASWPTGGMPDAGSGGCTQTTLQPCSLRGVSYMHGGAFLKKMQCVTGKALPASAGRARQGSLCSTMMVIRPHMFRSHSLVGPSSRYLMVHSRTCVLYTGVQRGMGGGWWWCDGQSFFLQNLIKEPMLKRLEAGRRRE